MVSLRWGMMMMERMVVWFLRITAVVLIIAFIPAVMPYRWMQAGHEFLGMGPLPELPLLVYLNRSISMLYFTIGILSWLMASDIHRYRPIIIWFAWCHVGMGIFLTIIDWQAGMPTFWTLIEGPSVLGGGLLLLGLMSRVRPT